MLYFRPTLFAIPGGFNRIWPIGDCFSIKNGRIEGAGVAPDISSAADRALDVALGF